MKKIVTLFLTVLSIGVYAQTPCGTIDTISRNYLLNQCYNAPVVINSNLYVTDTARVKFLSGRNSSPVSGYPTFSTPDSIIIAGTKFKSDGGDNAGAFNGGYNLYVGTESGDNWTPGAGFSFGVNSFYGYGAGKNSSGSFLTFIGAAAGRDSKYYEASTGFKGYSTALGASALRNVSALSGTIAIGGEAGTNNDTIGHTVFIGVGAGSKPDASFSGTHFKTIAIGTFALATETGHPKLQRSEKSVVIGVEAAFHNSAVRSILIGNNAGWSPGGGVTITDAVMLYSTAANDTSWRMATDGNADSTFSVSVPPLRKKTAAFPAYMNLGIGTRTPTDHNAKLEIYGNGNGAGTYALRVNNNTGTNNALVVNDAGNTSLGDTIAGAKLDVNGTMKVRILAAADTSDYIAYWDDSTSIARRMDFSTLKQVITAGISTEGTVTSVGLSSPVFSVGNSPVTSAGTFTVDFNTIPKRRILFGGSDGRPRTDESALFDTATNQFLGANGSATSPTYTFIGDSLMGMYRNSNNIAFSTGGTLRATISANGVRVVNGTATAPSISFTNASGTGLSNASNQLVFSANGAEGARLDASRNFMIGTTSTTFKLDVQGTARLAVTPVSNNYLDTVLVKDGSTGQIKVRVFANVVSSASSLNLDDAGHYSFSGTTATWTLPAVSGNTGMFIYIKNRGSGDITLNSNGGGNDVYDTAASNTLAIAPGAALVLYNDGTYFNVE